MLTILQFIFSSFWIWLGTCLMILCFADCVPRIIHFKGERGDMGQPGAPGLQGPAGLNGQDRI